MKLASMSMPTIIATTLIAALIWFVAEGQTLNESELETTLTLMGQVEGEAPVLVRPINGSDWGGVITIHIEGSTARIDQLLSEVASGIVLTTGIELPQQTGIHVVVLRDAIRRLPAFRGSGVTITSVVPERIEIEIDRLESMTLELRPEIEADLDTPMTLEPSSVLLSAPSTVIEFWRSQEDTSVAVRVSGNRLSGLSAGITHQVSGLPIELPAELRGRWETRLTPAQATASVRLRSRTRSYTVRELPVKVLLPPEAFTLWIVELPAETSVLKDVIFSGPEASVARIESGEAVPNAVIELSMEELEQGVGSKPARMIDLPPGVSYQVASSIVSINIRRLAGIDPNHTTPTTPQGEDESQPGTDGQTEQTDPAGAGEGSEGPASDLKTQEPPGSP